MLDDYRPAAAYYEHALWLDPQFARAYLGLAGSRAAARQFQEALWLLALARRAGVDDSEDAWIAGACYEELGNSQAALAAYERYLVARPGPLRRPGVTSRVELLQHD